MNIAGIGVGVGAFTKGYQEGERHRSEMEDADLRRELGKSQLKQVKREEEYQDELKNLYSDFQSASSAPAPAPAAGIANPAAVAPTGSAALNPALNKDAATSIPAGPETAVGGASGPAAVPTQGGIAAPGTTAPAPRGMGNMADMQAIIERRQNLDLKYGKINEVQALQMMKNFKTFQQEGIIDGMNYFQQTGDRAGAIERINATGAIKLDPNAKFEIGKKEIAPGVSIPNVVVSSPDGQHSFNQYDTMYNTLTPEKAFSLKHETGFKLAELTLKQQAEDNLKEYRTRMANARDREVAGTIDWHRAQIKESAARLEALTDDKKAKLRAETSQKAFDNILTAEGVSKEMTADKLEQLPKDKQKDYRTRLDRAFTAHAMWEMNTDPTGKQILTPSEAQTLVRNLSKMPADSIKYDQYGKGYIKYGDKNVFIPGVSKAPEQDKPAAATPAAPQAGVKPPAAPVGRPDDSAPGGIAGPSAASAAPALANPGLMPQRTAGETGQSFRDRVAEWDSQRQAYAAQQQAVSVEQERQRRLAERGGVGLRRPLVEGEAQPISASDVPANPITSTINAVTTPVGNPPARPAQGAPSIYANPAAWAAYRQQQRGGLRGPQQETR